MLGMGGFCLVVELNWEGCGTNWATLSCLYRNTIICLYIGLGTLLKINNLTLRVKG